MGHIGIITHFLTIDPNFLGHPSSSLKQNISKKNSPFFKTCPNDRIDGTRLVYLPTGMVDFYGKLVRKYTSSSHGSYGLGNSKNSPPPLRFPTKKHALDIQSYLLRFGVSGVFWGSSHTEPQEVFGCLLGGSSHLVSS